jgi:hypothetical protein
MFLFLLVSGKRRKSGENSISEIDKRGKGEWN